MRLLASICALIVALAPFEAQAASGPNATYGNIKVDSLNSGGPVSGATLAGDASGATNLGRSLQSRAQDAINPLDAPYNAPRNTKQVYGSTSISSGSSALTCAGCAFTAGDLGKYIVVQGAGTTGSTGAVSSLAVSTAGSYTAQPSITITAASGQSAAVRPLMSAASVTLASGGSGYTNGLQTLTANAAGCNTPVQVSVTVTSGVVTTINSITVAGSCWNINSTGSSAVTTTGPVGFGATLNITWGVAAADIQGGGWGYSLTGGAVTAAMSGGTFTTAATLGAVVVTAPVAPLATTIASVTDATHVQLATTASTSTSGSRYVTFGSNDGPAIQSALTKACTAGSRAAVWLPGDGWGLATTLEVPDNCGVSLFGSGRNITNVRALATPVLLPSYATSGAASLPSMIFKANFNGNFTLRELALDAVHLVAAPVFLHGMHGGIIADVYISNAAPQVAGGAGLVIGDPFTYIYANSLHVTDLVVQDRIGASTADLPLTGIGVYSPDNTFDDGIYVVNAAVQGVLDTGGSAWTKPHIFNYPTNLLSQYSMSVVGGRIDQPYLDTPIVAGVNQTYGAGAVLSLISPYCFWSGGPGPSSACVQVASGLAATVFRPAIGNPGFPGANAVVQLGTTGTQTVITPSVGVTGTSFTTGLAPAASSIGVTTHDGSTTGGTTLGNGAVDFSWARSSAAQSATGSFAFTLGQNVTASGFVSNAHGFDVTADGVVTRAFGQRVRTFGGTARDCWAANQFSTAGDQQVCRTIHVASTSSTTKAELTASNGNLATANALQQPAGSILGISGLLSARCSDGSAAAWTFTALVAKDASSVAALVGTPTFTSIGQTASIGTPTFEIEPTYKTGAVYITPAVSTSCHWMARMDLNEMR